MFKIALLANNSSKVAITKAQSTTCRPFRLKSNDDGKGMPRR